MLKKRICLLALSTATANQAMANDQEAAKGFIEDSRLDLFFHGGYINRDYKRGRQDKAEWGQAAAVTFTSGFTQGMVSVGVSVFGLYVACLDDGKGRSDAAGIDFSKQGDSGSAVDDLPEDGAVVKSCIFNTVFKYGDQMPSLPVLSYNNSRLLPESYSSTLIISKEIKGLELSAGRFTAESRKSTEGRDSGGLKSINVFGGKYAFTDHFNASLYASDVEDAPRKQYIDLNYTIPLQADQSLNFGFNGYRTKLDSDFADQNLDGNRDNRIWSLAAFYTIDAYTFMITHQRNTGDTGHNYGWYQNVGGIGDGGTTTWLTNSYWLDFNAEDERSWQVSYALDFAKYGVPSLTYYVAYVWGDNIKTVETGNGKKREIFSQVQYVVQSGSAKDLTLRLRSLLLYVSSDARSYNDDGNEIRAFIECPLGVF